MVPVQRGGVIADGPCDAALACPACASACAVKPAPPFQYGALARSRHRRVAAWAGATVCLWPTYHNMPIPEAMFRQAGYLRFFVLLRYNQWPICSGFGVTWLRLERTLIRVACTGDTSGDFCKSRRVRGGGWGWGSRCGWGD